MFGLHSLHESMIARIEELIMAEQIEKYTSLLRDEQGVNYSIEVYGEATSSGLWEGWVEFQPLDAPAPVLRTERETTQPNRQSLEYWASGLEPLYFEGAFARAYRKHQTDTGSIQ
jgi:hypothetical protein